MTTTTDRNAIDASPLTRAHYTIIRDGRITAEFSFPVAHGGFFGTTNGLNEDGPFKPYMVAGDHLAVLNSPTNLIAEFNRVNLDAEALGVSSYEFDTFSDVESYDLHFLCLDRDGNLGEDAINLTVTDTEVQWHDFMGVTVMGSIDRLTGAVRLSPLAVCGSSCPS